MVADSPSLDAFLELKLENEKLRAELRDLQVDYDDEDYRMWLWVSPTPARTPLTPGSARPVADPQPPFQTSQSPSTEDSDSSPSSSTPSSPGYAAPPRPAKVGRPPKDKEGREKKRAKKVAAPTAVPRANAGGEGEGMHVCVTCGRTDSPEWRKGPLGPKTLCNVSDLGGALSESLTLRLAVSDGPSATRRRQPGKTKRRRRASECDRESMWRSIGKEENCQVSWFRSRVSLSISLFLSSHSCFIAYRR